MRRCQRRCTEVGHIDTGIEIMQLFNITNSFYSGFFKHYLLKKGVQIGLTACSNWWKSSLVQYYGKFNMLYIEMHWESLCFHIVDRWILIESWGQKKIHAPSLNDQRETRIHTPLTKSCHMMISVYVSVWPCRVWVRSVLVVARLLSILEPPSSPDRPMTSSACSSWLEPRRQT